MHRPGTSFTGRGCDMPTDKLTDPDADSVAVKVERYSPDPDEISPSQSPSSGRASVADSSATDYFGGSNLLCGTPVIKQMEMMTRNYSDFMRSLAAKYNNQHSQETVNSSPSNGLLRNMDGAYKGAVLSPLFSPAIEETRKQSPPVLNDFQPLSEFPSSQTLLNLVRTASAHSAFQLESYLRGSRKRTHDGELKFDPLDLSVSPGKQSRNECGGATPSNPRDLCYVLKNKADVDSAETPERTRRTPSWLALLDTRQGDHDVSAGNVLVKLANRVRSSSPCSNQSENELAHWTVDDVVKFVTSIDSCNEYGEGLENKNVNGNNFHIAVHAPNCLEQTNDIFVIPRGSKEKLSRFGTNDNTQKWTKVATAFNVRSYVVYLKLPLSTQYFDSHAIIFEGYKKLKLRMVRIRNCTVRTACSERDQKFREQSIDGASLQLLSEEHLTMYLGMKLGPALKLRSAVSKMTGNCNVCMHCIHCHNDLAERASRSPSVSK